MPRPVTHDHTVILGAGPSGLGVGLGLLLHGYGGRISIIEKAERPGGLAGSFSWNGHSIDLGPHRLSPNIPRIRMLASEVLGPDLLVAKSQHGVHIDGRLYQFPPRVVDWLGWRPMAELGLFSLSFFASWFRWVTRRFQEDSFESVITYKFGRRFYDRIVAPMARKVWIDPQRIDPAFAKLRFAQVEPYQVVKKVLFPKQELNPSNFFYPRKGFQQIWSQMADWLVRAGHEVTYRSEAIAIHVERGAIRALEVREPGGSRTIDAARLAVVSTIPLPLLVRLLQGVDTAPLLEALSGIRIRSMLLVAFEFDQPDTLPYRTLIYPGEEFCFNRLFEQNKYSRATVTPGKSVVVADITVDPTDERLSWPDEKIVDLVRRDLQRLRYLDAARIAAATVTRVPYAYVVPDVETRRIMFSARHQLKNLANLFLLGRFSAGEYDNSDYAVDHGLELGAMLAGDITQLDYMMQVHETSGRSIVG